jgi:N-methylhydantoinase A
MTWRIGVDIGGTFIDFCLLDEASGALHSLKVLTTPDEPGREVIDGIALLEKRHGMKPAEVGGFVHGTTVGINTVIQRKGALLALLTTSGFEDVIELARLRLPDMYSLFCAHPEPLIPRDRIFGINERVLSDGSVETPLDCAGVVGAVARAREKRVDGIVVAFVNAYRNGAHEAAVKAMIREAAPELFVFTSSEIWPVIREYERISTVILNGYVHPRVDRYLVSLERALKERGVGAPAMITKSNGGVMSAELGRTACVNMLLSGTASGVIGASFLARQAGVENALTLDIGGTSADVALVIDGAAQFGMGETIGDFPLYVPSVSVTSIGDGGGSIAWVDGFGVLKVGPESAGSTPGPACYGRGGERPTITDAMAVCGFLGHAPLAYSSVSMDRGKAEAAVGTLARQLGMGLGETSEAIVKIAVSGMFVEVGKLIARYGVDPQDFTLLPFGGAGPMLGCLLARELGMKRVMIPLRPGVVSALGGLIADVKNDFIRTVFVDATAAAMPLLQETFAALRAEAESWLRRDQGYAGPATLALSADMSYRGQSFEIEVPLEPTWLEAGDIEAVAAAFHRRHAEIYDFSDAAAEAQIVNLRLVISGTTTRPRFVEQPHAAGVPECEKQIEVRFDGAAARWPLYRRDALRHGHALAGPAVIAQDDTTICIPAGFAGTVDAHGNLLLEWEGASFETPASRAPQDEELS